MNRLVLAFLLMFLAVPAYAEAIPDYALNKDFENCMGGSKDADRAAYCNCVRDGMRSWDLDTYGAVATDASKITTPGQAPQKLDELARGCIAKVLK